MKARLQKPVPCLLLAGAIAWTTGCARSDGAQPASTAKPTSAQPASAAAVATPPAVPLDDRIRGWKLGERYAYKTKLSTRVDFDGAGNSFDFDIVGVLEVSPAMVSSGAATLHAKIGDARIVSRVPGSQEELDELAAEIRATGAFFELEAGRTGALLAPEGMSQMAASTYRHIASALQFAHARDGAPRYTAEEYDTTGRFVAEYSKSGRDNVWQKRKLSYVGILGSEALPDDMKQRVAVEVVSSRGEVRLSPEGRPVAVRLADEQKVKGAQAPIASSLTVELESVENAATTPASFADLLAKAKRVPVDQPIPNEEADESLDAARIGGLDFETVAARLEERARAMQAKPKKEPTDKPPSAEEVALGEKDLREEGRLFHALSALFRQQPGTTNKAVERVRGGSPATDTFVDALGNAATADAHRALAKILAVTSASHEVQSRVILSLARTPKPTPEAVLALKGVLERNPVNAGALYGLGTFSRVLRDEGKTKEATELGDFLAARFNETNGPMTTANLLRAVANSGYIGALPRVLPFLDHEDEQLRATAVRAVQSMRDPRIDALIAARLTTDTSARVRISAIEAAKVREPSDPLVEALVEAGTHGTDRHLRFRAVELMAGWLKKRPELRATLEAVAKNETEPKIRERAQAAL